MSLIASINKNSFEIKDELDEYIYCDYEIRNVIATLNKKGYKTNYSCAGHNELGLMWPLHKENIDKLEEYLRKSKNDKTLHFIKKEKNIFIIKMKKYQHILIFHFNKTIIFKSIPVISLMNLWMENLIYQR